MTGSKKKWYEQQLRILQTVLREPDIVNYDAQSVVQYMENIHANCLVVNAGGIVDFFKHDLFSYNPNSFMKEEDILKDITEACHAKGYKVIVRVDFRGVDKRIYELAPDLFAVDENGEHIFWASPNIPNPLYAPCYQSYYRNEHALKYIETILQKYDIDGVWENSYSQQGICYCKTCQDTYREELDKELPRGGDFYSAAYDEYREWKAAAVSKHFKECRRLIQRYGEDKAYCAEVFGLFYDHYKSSSQDLFDIKDDFDFLVTPLFTGNQQPLSAPSTLIKFLRSLDEEKTPVMLFGHLGTNNQLRYISSAAEETRIWMWQAVSAGGSLWNCIFNGQHPGSTYDRRNALLCQDVYAYMEENEALLAEQAPVTDVYIFYSRATNQIFGQGNTDKDHYVTHLIGLEQVLLKQKIQYSFLLDDQLDSTKLKPGSVLVMPNAAILSDEQLASLEKFVSQGGKLLATYQTSLFRPDGSERNDLGLAKLFGCKYTGISKDASLYGYQGVREEHALTKGIEETEMLANWGQNLLVRVREDSEAYMPVSYIPQIFPQSPERSWLREYETEYPAMLLHKYGAGEVIYFPNEVDRSVWQHGHRDFSILLTNALDYLLEEKQSVRSEAPSSLHFTLNRDTRDAKQYLLHAVNTTSAPVRPVHEIIPLHNITVEIEVEGEELQEWQVLWGEQNIEVEQALQQANNQLRLTIKIPYVQEYLGLRLRMK